MAHYKKVEWRTVCHEHRCRGCHALCADLDTLIIHERFCEDAIKAGYYFNPKKYNKQQYINK